MFFWQAESNADPPTMATIAAAVAKRLPAILGPDPTVLIDPPLTPAATAGMSL